MSNMSGDSNEERDTLDHVDEPLVEELRRAANRFDPPPPAVLEAARDQPQLADDRRRAGGAHLRLDH
jgi:hypothetical protein